MNLLTKLRRVPLGGWVLIALVATFGASLALKSFADSVRTGLLGLRSPRLHPAAQTILWTGEPAPQAFTRAGSEKEASALSAEIGRAGNDVLSKAHDFHRIDLTFMGVYGLLLVASAFWARKRARILTESLRSAPQPPASDVPASAMHQWSLHALNTARAVALWLGQAPRWIWPLGIAGAVTAIVGDLLEHHACVQMLDGRIDQSLLALAAWGYRIKWAGVAVSAAVGLLGGVWASLLTRSVREALRNTWELSLRAHHFAMKARFSVLASALFTILLLTGPGKDIIRTVATGAFIEEKTLGRPEPDFERLGWFVVALLVLSGTCWAWARLVLAIRFSRQEGVSAEGETTVDDVEARLRRDLPIYYGAVPFVAAASAFAIAPIQEAGSLNFPVARFLAASLAPLFLFFILPLGLVIFRASAGVARATFGPLSATLGIYSALAVWHALANLGELGVLGVVPIVVLVTALVVFGLDRPAGILILPVALFLSALLFGGWHSAWAASAPSAMLLLLGAFVYWGADRIRGTDTLYIPLKFGSRRLLALPFSEATRTQVRSQILDAPPAQRELRRQKSA